MHVCYAHGSVGKYNVTPIDVSPQVCQIGSVGAFLPECPPRTVGLPHDKTHIENLTDDDHYALHSPLHAYPKVRGRGKDTVVRLDHADVQKFESQNDNAG